ncbi:MAG: hypothetical protein DWP97_09955, partial [Calditrichaeota bacterium]
TSLLPTGASFIDNLDGTGTFDWIPDFTQSGVYDITFYASDGIDVDSELVSITITETGNQLPVLDPIGAQIANEGEQLLLVITASDLDDIPVLTTTALPAGVIFTDSGNGIATFDWTPDFTQAGSYDITFYASDGVATDSELVTITVQEAGNQPPVLDPIGPQTGMENTLFNLIVSASDGDGTIPTLSTSLLPAGATFVDNLDGTGSLNWTPSFAQAGLYAIVFYASDGSTSDSEVVSVSISDFNQAPTLDSIGNKSVVETRLLTFIVTASDPDGIAPVMTTTALPVGAAYTDNNDGTATFNWVPSLGQAGDYAVTFYAADGADTAFEAITITVVAGNVPPVLNEVGPQTVVEGGTLIVNVSATDPDGLAPVLRAEKAPLNSSFVDNGDGTGVFTFNPSFIQAGLRQVTFVADDGFDIDKEVVIIQVYEAGDQPPQFDSIPTPPAVVENDILEGVITAYDPDAGPVTIYLDTTTTIPANFVLIDSGNGVASYTSTPDFTQSGVYIIGVIVDDGTQTTQILINFTVSDSGPQPPVMNPVADQAIGELQPLSFGVSASDPEGEIPNLSVTLPSGASFLDNNDGTGTFNWTPGAFQAGVYDLTFYATDVVDPLLVDSQMMQITVIDTNRVPFYFIPYSGSTIPEGDSVVFSIFVTDPDSTMPTIEAYLDGTDSLASNMTFVDSGNGVGVLSFYPDYDQGSSPIATFYNIRFRVCDEIDPALCVTSQLRVVQVTDVNRPPTITIVQGTGPFTINEGELLTLNATVVEEDGDVITDFHVEDVPLNATLFQIANVATFDFTPDFTQAGQYFVSFMATDDNNLGDTVIVEINVLDAGNQPPTVTSSIGDTTDVFINTGMDMLITVADPEGQAVTITANPILPNASFVDSANGNAVYSFNPDSTQIGIVSPVTFIATDAAGAADTMITNFRIDSFLRGDLDDNTKYTMNDVVFIVNYIFHGGQAPNPVNSGDIDYSGGINVADIAYLINFMYKAGPRPPQ